MENKAEIDIGLMVAIASMGTLLLALFIIFIVLLYQKRMQANKIESANAEKEHQKKLFDTTLEVAEKERQRIARNIHDEVGVNLSVLKMNFNQLFLNSSRDEKVEAIIGVSYAIIEDSIEIIREVSSDLRPKTLMVAGLVAAVKELTNRINSSGAARASLLSSDKIKIPIADKNKELQLHRVIKEILNNTLKHAKPTFIEITVENIENRLNVIILHNGMGITTKELKVMAENSSGLGLKSIFTRTELLNASLDFIVEPNKKAKVVLKCNLL